MLFILEDRVDKTKKLFFTEFIYRIRKDGSSCFEILFKIVKFSKSI